MESNLIMPSLKSLASVLFIVLTLFLVALIFASCSKDNDVPPAPTITSFTPLAGTVGTTVIISGSNFNNEPANNIVKINGVPSTVTASTTTQLTVTVPAAATTGKLSVEINNVEVKSIDDFEVLKDIPRNGLVAFYPFTGNGVCSNSELNFNFSLAGAPTLVNDRYNRPSQAISFNASTQYSEVLKAVIPGQPWTVSFWMDPGNLTLFDHANYIGSW